MTRGRIVLLALVLAGLAVWALAGFPQRDQGRLAPPTHPDMDDASRAELERVLRDSRADP